MRYFPHKGQPKYKTLKTCQTFSCLTVWRSLPNFFLGQCSNQKLYTLHDSRMLFRTFHKQVLWKSLELHQAFSTKISDKRKGCFSELFEKFMSITFIGFNCTDLVWYETDVRVMQVEVFRIFRIQGGGDLSKFVFYKVGPMSGESRRLMDKFYHKPVLI